MSSSFSVEKDSKARNPLDKPVNQTLDSNAAAILGEGDNPFLKEPPSGDLTKSNGLELSDHGDFDIFGVSSGVTKKWFGIILEPKFKTVLLSLASMPALLMSMTEESASKFTNHHKVFLDQISSVGTIILSFPQIRRN